MTGSAWWFSAKLAWSRTWLKWTASAALLIALLGSFAFLWSVGPTAQRAGTVILHYNIYLGIDEIRPWPWIFLLPAAWVSITALDLAFAFGLYRVDPHFSSSLVVLALAWALPWLGALFYLSLINV